MFPAAITDHLNQLDQLKADDDDARSQLQMLDGQLAALRSQRDQQGQTVTNKDSALTQAQADVITLIQTYYKPGGTIPAASTPTEPPAETPAS